MLNRGGSALTDAFAGNGDGADDEDNSIPSFPSLGRAFMRLASIKCASLLKSLLRSRFQRHES